MMAILNKHLAFHTVQLSDQSRDYPSQGSSRPSSSPISRCHLDPQFLWYCPSGNHSSRGETLSLCISHCVFMAPATSSIQVSPGAGPASLFWSGGSCKVIVTDPPKLLRPATVWVPPGARLETVAAVVPTQVPGNLPSLCNLLTIYFSISPAIFGLQASYKLRFRWLFTLFFKRSARCPSWVHK